MITDKIPEIEVYKQAIKDIANRIQLTKKRVCNQTAYERRYEYSEALQYIDGICEAIGNGNQFNYINMYSYYISSNMVNTVSGGYIWYKIFSMYFQVPF